jgi:hypothetical protein
MLFFLSFRHFRYDFGIRFGLFVLFYLGVSFQSYLKAQVALDYYLPKNVSYNPAIPTPESYLGYQVGEWHVTHDQLVGYMKKLDEASDRISLEVYGKTYENRPLLLLTVTSPQNHNNLPSLKAQHLQLTDPTKSAGLDIKNMPLVVWMGYTVHGNEQSGDNAALLVAYYLAAAQGDGIDSLLSSTIILIDPCLNPDGVQRASTWVNQHKSKNLVTDPQSREFNEVYPGGRFNHYWFDLNRDWLYVQHPESQGRIKKFHEWRPNILTDHHEMGTSQTFFFQPGEPTRVHPLTPAKNKELTAKIGAFHAKGLDNIKSLYFTEETFDDFYYGKGSTFPDIHGCVGILFEQGSSRGHAQESPNGVLRFPFTIRNHVTASMTTLQASQKLKTELLEYQRNSYLTAYQEAQKSATKYYVFGTKNDAARNTEILRIMLHQQIDVFELGQSISANGKTFEPGSSFAVPVAQSQSRVIKAMFDKRTTFEDSLFYDISAFSLPYAMNIPYAEVTTASLGKKVEKAVLPAGKVTGSPDSYAFVWRWNDYFAPKITYALQSEGYNLKVMTEPFSAEVNGKLEKFDSGTILLPTGIQNRFSEQIYARLVQLTTETGIEIFGLKTGLTPSGADLGGNAMATLRRPEVVLPVGTGVTPTDAGEVWYVLDQRFDIPVSMPDMPAFNRLNLERYTTVVMVGGSYSEVNETTKQKLKTWIQNGGTLVCMTESVEWAINNGFSSAKLKRSRPDSLIQRPYNAIERYSRAASINGAIFEVKLDNTHPLCFGYSEKTIPVFRDNTVFLEKPRNPYAFPVTYTANPLLSGFISAPNLTKLKNSPAIVVNTLGQGRVILMTDNPNFRAFWWGTNKLFLNTLFFGNIIDPAAGR